MREPGANGGGHGVTVGEVAANGRIAHRWRRAASAGARRASLAKDGDTVILLVNGFGFGGFWVAIVCHLPTVYHARRGL